MQSGEIVLLKELHKDRHVIGKYLRVTGNITMLDFANNVCQIEHTQQVLWVDMKLIDSHDLQVSTLVQFIGEICGIAEKPIAVPASSDCTNFYLQAKVLRIVEGLDMALYEQALMSRRAFLRGGGAL